MGLFYVKYGDGSDGYVNADDQQAAMKRAFSLSDSKKRGGVNTVQEEAPAPAHMTSAELQSFAKAQPKPEDGVLLSDPSQIAGQYPNTTEALAQGRFGLNPGTLANGLKDAWSRQGRGLRSVLSGLSGDDRDPNEIMGERPGIDPMGIGSKVITDPRTAALTVGGGVPAAALKGLGAAIPAAAELVPWAQAGIRGLVGGAEAVGANTALGQDEDQDAKTRIIYGVLGAVPEALITGISQTAKAGIVDNLFNKFGDNVTWTKDKIKDIVDKFPSFTAKGTVEKAQNSLAAASKGVDKDIADALGDKIIVKAGKPTGAIDASTLRPAALIASIQQGLNRSGLVGAPRQSADKAVQDFVGNLNTELAAKQGNLRLKDIKFLVDKARDQIPFIDDWYNGLLTNSAEGLFKRSNAITEQLAKEDAKIAAHVPKVDPNLSPLENALNAVRETTPMGAQGRQAVQDVTDNLFSASNLASAALRRKSGLQGVLPESMVSAKPSLIYGGKDLPAHDLSGRAYESAKDAGGILAQVADLPWARPLVSGVTKGGLPSLLTVRGRK